MLKTLATALIIASFTLPPAIAFAQAGGPPPPPGAPPPPHSGDYGQMHQMRGQFEQIHQQERDKVLGALSPAHRQLLANVIGQMAVAQTPDRKAAAAQLDAALTPGERDAILAAHRDAMNQMHALFAQQMQSQSSGMQGPPKEHRTRNLTAGQIALMVSHAGPSHDFHHSQ